MQIRLNAMGVHYSNIDFASQLFFKSKGYSDEIIHRISHGISLGGHEQSWLSVESEDKSLPPTQSQGQKYRRNV